MSTPVGVVVSRHLPPAVEDRLCATYAPIWAEDILRAEAGRRPPDRAGDDAGDGAGTRPAPSATGIGCALPPPPPRPADLVRLAAATGARALLITPTDRMAAADIAALPDRVAIIATYSVGVEHIDIAAAAERGIAVTNTPGVLTEATADIALLLMLGAARRASEGERLVRSGGWTGWTPTQLLGTHLGGRRLGIVGLGRIGRAMARRARALGMRIAYHNRQPLPDDQAEGACYHPTLDGLLAESDVLSLHCPATPETHHLLTARRLALMPPGAIVVNTARGAIIEDEALIAALTTGQIAAAGLDVYDGEPHVHSGYAALPNTFLLPHLGSATVETRNAMGWAALDALDAFFAGTTPLHRVDLARS